MSFRLFGVNIEIQIFFWLTAGMLGYFRIPNITAHFGLLVVYMLVVLVSVLTHELGHAFAIMRHRIEPEITLHGMGGTTNWRPVLPLGRVDMVVISAAGPFNGFILAGVVYALTRLAPGLVQGLPVAAQFAIQALIEVNVAWGIFNLIPVMPFDGGHILEHALGPKRIRLSAGISFAVGAAAAVYLAYTGFLFGAMFLGMGAFKSYQRFRAEGPDPSLATPPRRGSPPQQEALPAELAALLQSARHALTEEDYNRAIALAHRALEGDGGSIAVPARASREALEIVAWAHLLEDRIEAANETLARARKHGEPDASLAGAVLFARRDLAAARRVLEEARSRGDDRKEVVGLLIQILIEQGEVARAAAVALDIVDTLSTEDARRMAQIAFEGRAYSWSARLFAALFDRARGADDAYDAARATALDGDQDRALEWLRKAVEAGFSDRARAWSDAALEVLRAGSGLESVLPRP